MHLVVLEKIVMGPMSAHDVVDLFRKDPNIFHSVKWISPEGMAPVLVLEWFADYTENGVLEDILSADVPQESDSGVRQTSDGRRYDLPPVNGGLTPSEAIKGRKSKLREWLALSVLALFGILLLWVGIKVMRPARSGAVQEKPLAAKLLGATPDALRNYQALLEGKIERDPQKYSRALLKLQKDRTLYPEGHLPSAELTAAIVLVHLRTEELDEREDWKQLLQRLPSEARQQGIALAGYELSRVFSVRREILAVAQSSKSKTVKTKILKETLAELTVILERMVRVVPKSEPEEKVLHGMLLSRILSLTLISALEYPEIFANEPLFKSTLAKLPDLHPFLGTADKMILTELAKIVNDKTLLRSDSAVWEKSLAGMLDINEQTRFICQLNETGSGTDALLFLLTQSAVTKKAVPEVSAVFDKCFVGLRLYPRLSALSAGSEHVSVTEFAGAGAADESLLKKFRKSFPTFNPLIARLKGEKNNAGEWMLVLYGNGVLGGRISSAAAKSQSAMCGKAMLSHSMCIQTRWIESSRKWRDLVPLVIELRDDINPQELSLLGQNFLFHAARESLLNGGRKKVKEIFEAMRTVRDLVDPEDPQIQFLLDYAQSLGIET
ncbi:MAG: hypothetical protein EBR09_00770 [Proteobacteria bacterium]|nr:hypothetical protein [Pseudomonadota bacterium]